MFRDVDAVAVLKYGTYIGLEKFSGNDIWGKTIGVIGIGRISAEVTRMGRLDSGRCARCA